MKTLLHPCSACNQSHALVWYIRKGGKRELGVLCDYQPVVRHVKGDTIVADHIKFIVAKFEEGKRPTDEELEGIPTHHTAASKKESALKGNLGFALMHLQPGEARDDRPLDLPRPATPAPEPEPVAPPSETDEAKAQRLEHEIAQCGQAQKELTTQIEGLSRRRTQLENQERELRRELRTVQTLTLKLE